LRNYASKENWDNKLPKTIYRPTRGRLSWLAFLTIVLIGVVVIVVMADHMTGTVAKIEPASNPDGTAEHPYADVNQCPPGTDIVIWPEEWRSITNIPRVGFSICFVGGQPKKEVRGR
jgi:hypothetical protein